MTWAGYDAVVLTAIARGADTLDGLVVTIDYLNHDVPPADVVAGSLSRLEASGLVRIETGPIFALLPPAAAVVSRRPGGPIGQVVDVGTRLDDVPLSEGGWVLPHRDWDAAVDAYLGRHA